MVVSARWLKPSLTYCWVSSTTMPEPLSALFITRSLSVERCLRACFCSRVRFGVDFSGCTVLISFLILFRYFSIGGEAISGVQELLCLKG